MEDIDSSPPVPTALNPRKRAAPGDSPGKKPLNLTGSQFVLPTPPDTEESSNASPRTAGGEQPRAASPAPSTSTLSSVEAASPSPAMAGGSSSSSTRETAAAAGGSNPPPAKRRKLTPEEKQERQRDKEARERERAEKRAAKDEERRAKDEDKRARDEERRRKAEEREARKREKELEEQRHHEAKLKKERSQMRLGAFFGAKPASSAPSSSSSHAVSGAAGRNSVSVERDDAVPDAIRRSASPTKATSAPVVPEDAAASASPPVSDYHRYFLPFELPSHSSIADRFIIENPADLAYWQGAFDHELQDPSLREKVDLGLMEPTAVVDDIFRAANPGPRGVRQPHLRAVMDQIQGTSQEPIDLTRDRPSQAPLQALQQATRRHIQFHEDVRPAWFGTYTKAVSPRSVRKVMLNPFSRQRKDTDYDYDSEAEWEEPEEGEDILADDEEEVESVGDADDMDGFLDDEDDALKNKRKMITGDLQPTCTGLCWESAAGTVVQSTDDGEAATGTPTELRGMRLGVLLPGFSGQTIDPFSTAYWANDMAPPAAPAASAARATTSLLPGARPPLQERNSNGALTQSLLGAAAGEKGPITAVAATPSGSKRGPKPQPKTLRKEDLAEFKEAVVGSNLKKADLCKALKTRFPKMTNETIKDTLGSQFAQVGTGKADKKWVFVSAT